MNLEKRIMTQFWRKASFEKNIRQQGPSRSGEKTLSPASHSTVAFGSGGVSRVPSKWGRDRGGRTTANHPPQETESPETINKTHAPCCL